MSALKLLWNFFETTQENKISWKGIYLGKIQFDVSYTVYASSSDWLCFLTYVLDGLECSSLPYTALALKQWHILREWAITLSWVCTRPVHWLTSSSAARLLDWARPTPFTPPKSLLLLTVSSQRELSAKVSCLNFPLLKWPSLLYIQCECLFWVNIALWSA